MRFSSPSTKFQVMSGANAVNAHNPESNLCVDKDVSNCDVFKTSPNEVRNKVLH